MSLLSSRSAYYLPASSSNSVQSSAMSANDKLYQVSYKLGTNVINHTARFIEVATNYNKGTFSRHLTRGTNFI
jgi:hypothetical protein